MSLLNKHPFLNSVLDDLSDEELEALQTLIDGTGPSTFVYRSLVNVSALLSASDKLSHGVNLELSKKKGIVSGWFLGTSFIQFYANRPEMQMYKINLSDYTYEVVNEPFTATDLRQAIDAKLGGGGGVTLNYATNAEIDALFDDTPVPTTWNVTYNLTGCWQGSGSESQVQDGGLLQFQLHPNYGDYEWQSVVITMGGVDITSTAWNEGNEEVLISHVTGDVVITAVCIETQPGEDIPIESIRYTDGQGQTCIGFNMNEGESVDLWTNLEILPANYTDGVEFISDDDGIVMVDSGGIATATGVPGESTIITISAMLNPNISTTVSIAIGEDEPVE